jgi:iron complex transport system substrate-binding protein
MLKYIICGLFILGFFACADQVKQQEFKVKPPFLTLQDEMGRSFTLEKRPERILPLCASSMEFLMLLCDSQQIVGRTPELTSPSWIVSKPVVNNYPLDFEQVMTLKPDLIVSKEGMLSNEQINKLNALGFPVYMQKQNSIDEMISSLSRIGLVLGKEEKGKEEAMRLKTQFDALKQAAGQVPQTAVALIGTDPIYVFGHASYMTDVFRYIGLRNAIDSSMAQLYPVVDQEYLLKLNPDYLILPASQQHTQRLFRTYPLLKTLKAYQHKHCIYVNEDLLSRPSPNVLQAAQYMANQLHAHE